MNAPEPIGASQFSSSRAGLEGLLRLDAEVALREVVGQARVGLGEADLQGELVDRGGGLVVAAEPRQRGAVAAVVHPVVEVVRDDLGGQVGAVGELHVGLQLERPLQAVVAHAPRLGEPGHDLVVLVERDQAVEHVVAEVGLLDPAAEHAGRFLLVGVDDRSAVDAFTARGRLGAGGATRETEGRGGCGCEQGECSWSCGRSCGHGHAPSGQGCGGC